MRNTSSGSVRTHKMTRVQALAKYRKAAAMASVTFASPFYAPGTAHAQDAAQAEPSQEIIVTANKREEKLGDVGSGISVVTAKNIDDLHASSLGDYLQLLPGVSLISSGTSGRGAVAIRGIVPQGSGATTVTYVDDVAIGATSVLADPGSYYIDINPSDIQRVEVLKGPQGTLYGASSMGGVIKYVLKKPDLEKTSADLSQDFSFVDGGRPSSNFRADVSTPLVADTLALRVSGFYQMLGGYVSNAADGSTDVNKGTNWGARASLYWKPSDRFDLVLTGLRQHNHAAGLDTLDIDSTTGDKYWSGGDVFRDTPEGFNQTTDLFSLEANYHTGLGAVVLASSYSRNRNTDTIDYSYLWEEFGVASDTGLSGIFAGVRQTRKYTSELRFTSNRFGPFEAIVGGYFNRENVSRTNSYGYYGRTATIADANILGTGVTSSDLTEVAGFANLTAYITDKLDITSGVRHARISQTFDAANSGLLFTGDSSVSTDRQHFTEDPNTYLASIRWRPAKDFLIYALASSGYRPGGGRSIPIGAPAGFVDHYLSDSLWNYEAGARFGLFNNMLTVDADAFWIDWKNIQTYVTYDDVSTDGNGGKAVSKGFEGQINLRPAKGINLGGVISYNDAHFTETTDSFNAGERVPGISRLTWSLSGSYSIPMTEQWSATVGGDVSHRSSQLDTYLAALPGYTVGNAYVNLNRGNLELSIFVKNLTNKTALLSTQFQYSSLGLKTVIRNAPRTFGVCASAHF